MRDNSCPENRKLLNPIYLVVVVLALIPLLLDVYIHSRPLSEDFDFLKEAQLQRELSQKGTWVISEQQGPRGAVEFTDATDEYLFLGYSHMSTCVDVYDRNGNFQFSILFADIQKGRFRMRCEGDLLYILTRKGQLFVFDGSTEVMRQTADEAENSGYSKEWFQKRSYSITISDEIIEGVDSSGEDIFEFPLPNGVRVNTKQSPFLQLMILLLVILVVLYMTRTLRNGPPTCLRNGK